MHYSYCNIHSLDDIRQIEYQESNMETYYYLLQHKHNEKKMHNYIKIFKNAV